MNYSEWLLATFPELAHASSVKIFNLIKQAKSETKSIRLLVSIIGFLLVVLFGYSVGYFFGKYTEIDFGIVLAVCIAFSSLFFGQIEKRIAQRIVCKKLTELVDQSA